ncbi:SapC family protein [Desulfonatronovibrio magnus]|uniref:SapC family protein n=1 Tax=Desulfonatronovibrio magnus TaxID=698827 RepID=UPI0005EB520C|nr:SapC family protein [Desulfonatronovibrio magnus]
MNIPALYKKPVAVSLQAHKDKAWLQPSTLSFASNLQAVPVFSAEAFAAAGSLPLAVVNNCLVALTSFARGKNCYLTEEGKARDSFAPALLKCYPFARLVAKGSKQPVLCVDEDHVVEPDTSGAMPFFDNNGHLSGRVKAVMQVLEQLHHNRKLCIQACVLLKEHGLLEPFTINPGKNQQVIKGFFQVNHQLLSQIDPEKLGILRDALALDIAYAQIASMYQIPKLLKYTQEGLEQEQEFEFDSNDVLSFDNI